MASGVAGMEVSICRPPALIPRIWVRTRIPRARGTSLVREVAALTPGEALDAGCGGDLAGLVRLAGHRGRRGRSVGPRRGAGAGGRDVRARAMGRGPEHAADRRSSALPRRVGRGVRDRRGCCVSRWRGAVDVRVAEDRCRTIAGPEGRQVVVRDFVVRAVRRGW